MKIKEEEKREEEARTARVVFIINYLVSKLLVYSVLYVMLLFLSSLK